MVLAQPRNFSTRVKMAMYEYHIYKEEWEAAVGEELKCEREKNNAKDPYAVAVVHKNVIVGHLPRKISRISALFLKRQGKISCKVLGRHRYSATRGPGDSVCKFSLFKKFRVLSFRGLLRPRKFFNNENFPIYGTLENNTLVSYSSNEFDTEDNYAYEDTPILTILSNRK